MFAFSPIHFAQSLPVHRYLPPARNTRARPHNSALASSRRSLLTFDAFLAAPASPSIFSHEQSSKAHTAACSGYNASQKSIFDLLSRGAFSSSSSSIAFSLVSIFHLLLRLSDEILMIFIRRGSNRGMARDVVPFLVSSPLLGIEIQYNENK